jgi:hypothetical protein
MVNDPTTPLPAPPAPASPARKKRPVLDRLRTRILAATMSVLAFVGIGAAIGGRAASQRTADAETSTTVRLPSDAPFPDDDDTWEGAIPGGVPIEDGLPPDTSTQGS